MGLNIGGYSKDRNSPKHGLLHTLVSRYTPDVLCLSELNIAWHKLSLDQRLGERAQQWWNPVHTRCSWYQQYPAIHSPHQPGGTAIIAMANVASRVQSSGNDSRGLGRWAWLRLQGKDNHHITIISAYRPVKNTRDSYSVYNQQLYHLQEVFPDQTPCPRTQFTTDLSIVIQEFRAKGDLVVLSLDVNQDVRVSHHFNTTMSELSMIEAILSQHGDTAPSTYRRGSVPIDGIYRSLAVPNTSSGYLPFVEGLSDHRPMYLDVDWRQALGYLQSPPASIRCRRLRTQDPRVVRKYLDRYRSFIAHHNLVARAIALENSLTPNQEMTWAQQEEYEAIDQLRTYGMLWAESKCRKLRTGKVPWSPNLEKALLTHRLWSLLQLRRQSHDIGWRRIFRLASRLRLQHLLDCDDMTVQEYKSQAWKHYQQVKLRSTTLRASWLEDLAVAREEAGLDPVGKSLRLLRVQERSRRDHARINRAIRPAERRSLTMVQSTAPDGRVLTHTTKASIERAGLAENDARFRQANATPLQSPTAQSILGSDGCSEAATQILLNGTVPPDIASLDNYMVTYLKAYKVGQLPIFDIALSTEDHIAGWKKAREATSSGISGLHFGHFIAGSMDADIAPFEASMSSIPWQTGYSPSRWQKGLNVMIEKKKGNFHVERLRTILLFEADFNQGNKWLGRNVMKHAEAHYLIALEQYGSRKDHEAINQGLNKRLTYDACSQLNIRCALCSNDAKSCYDRILHFPAGLAMRRAGAPISAVRCMLQTLQNLDHHIRTAFGDSTTSFQSNDGSGIPIHGTGQGNGASPAIWVLVSSPIFDAMRSLGHGCHLRTAHTGQYIPFAGYSFVDDADLIVTDPDPFYTTDAPSISQRMQASVDDWEGLIRMSGGAIVPGKSHWYEVDYKWTTDGHRYLDSSSSAILTVLDKDGNRSCIEKVDPDEGRRTVGVRIAPSGANTTEFQVMMEKIDTWADKIRSSRLPRDLVWLSLTTGLLKQLEYPLPATTFTQQECNRLMDRLVQVALPYCGVNRNFPKALVFASIAMGGLGVPHLYIEQSIQHLKRVLTFGSKPTDITGHLLRVNLENMCLELGVDCNPFLLSYERWGFLCTDVWMTHLWKFLSDHDIQLHAPVPSIPTQREGDSFLMTLAIATNSTTTQLRNFNTCRQFLRVARLTDIVEVSGRRIRHHILARTPCCQVPEGYYTWKRCPNPTPKQWGDWNEVLGRILPSFPDIGRVHTQLGEWHRAWRHWDWFLSHDGQLLLHYNDDLQVFEYHTKLYSRNQKFNRTVDSTNPWYSARSQLPLRRVTCHVQDDNICLEGTDSHRIHGSEFFDIDIPVCTFDSFAIQRFYHQTTWAQQVIYIPSDSNTLSTISNLLQTGSLCAVSDGSYKDGASAAAWLFGTPDGTEFFSGGFMVPGDSDIQDPYRGELAGIFAILWIIRQATANLHLQNTAVHLGCDNLGALQRLFENQKPCTYNESHQDLIRAIQHCLSDMPSLTIQWRHVKGHQDDNPDASLDIWAEWNILCDLRAKDIRTTDKEAVTLPYINTQWQIRIDGVTLTTNIPKHIRRHCLDEAARQYWNNSNKLGSGDASMIDWHSHSLAMNESDLARRRFVIKHASGWCGVGKNLRRWKFETDDSCPLCGQPNEDARHVWQCQSPDANRMWSSQSEKLQHWFRKHQTAPAIADTFLTRLRSWRSNTRQARIRSRFPGLQEAVRAQDTLGWAAALEGKVCLHWAECQETYFRFIKSRRSGRRWVTALIRKLWEVAWDFWMHRNGFKVAKREALQRSDLVQQVQAEYSTGVEGLHRRYHSLFHPVSLSQRLYENNQSLASWLLRVSQAREHSRTAPVSDRDTQLLQRDARQRRRQQEAHRLQRQQQLFHAWLHGT